MTDQRDEIISSTAKAQADASGSVVLPGISRRALIRGASAAVPTILTLNSGSVAAAAMASARLISPSTLPENGNYLCLSEVAPDNNSGKYEVTVAEITDGDITEIPAGETYYTQQGASGNRTVSPGEMCDNLGGTQDTFHYQPGGNGKWAEIKVNRGIIASCDAIGSFGSVSSCSGDV